MNQILDEAVAGKDFGAHAPSGAGSRATTVNSGGKRLLPSRGEKLERTFAHCYETGGMRRLYLRGRDNVAKRALIHGTAFNLGLMMRAFYGLAKPRSCSEAVRALILAIARRLAGLPAVCPAPELIRTIFAPPRPLPSAPVAA